REAKRPAERSGPGAVVLEARNLSTSLGHRDIGFRLHKGEILGLYGLVGAGRSELARAIFGAGEFTAGELLIDGQPARIRNVHEALSRWRMGYISEDRKQEGLILMHSVSDNIAVTIWRRLANSLAADAAILIIDEPTVGIDIKTKAYIHELIGEITRQGLSIILISSDMPEMVALADRILVMHDFRIVGEVANDHRYDTVSKAIMQRIHAVEETATAAE